MATRGQRTDPYLGFRFTVTIDDTVVGGFSEVSGLQAEVEVHTFREGGRNEYLRQIPGPVRYPSAIVLKHGITDDQELFKWFRDAAEGKVIRKSASVVLRDAEGNEKRKWSFQKVYPTKWKGPDFRASTAEVAIESLELVHEGFL